MKTTKINIGTDEAASTAGKKPVSGIALRSSVARKPKKVVDVPAGEHIDPFKLTNRQASNDNHEKNIEADGVPLSPGNNMQPPTVFRPAMVVQPVLPKKSKSKKRLITILLVSLIVIVGVGLGSWVLLSKHSSSTNALHPKSFSLKVETFKLLSTVPSDNATNINTASDIVLNFSQPVNPDKFVNNMFLTPKVAGTYVQGATKDQIIFKPAVPFTQGTKVSVMINGTIQNARGSKLGAPYEYNFTTSIPNNEILFQDQSGLIDQVTSLASGQKETYTTDVGSTIGTGASITLYKGDITDLLDSLVYRETTSYGETAPNFSDLSVPTGGLQEVSTQTNVSNGGTYTVQEPDGLYLAVATNAAGNEVGFVWIDYSNFGVLLRQDDQKVVLDAQQFSSSQDVAANVKFYSLNDYVKLLGQQTVNGLTTAHYPYSSDLDLAVATSGQEVDIIPVNILNSGGDIRVDQNLSTAIQVYGVTDKPTYGVGDMLRYAGFVRDDNDAQYTVPTKGSVKLYIAHYKGGRPLASFSAPLDDNGMFSGSITVASSWLNSGDASDQLQLFAAATNSNSLNDIAIAGFSVTNQSNPKSNITVHFSQTEYLPNEPITATITATDATGQPLANTAIDVHTFSEDYYENDPASDLDEYGSVGTELPSSPTTVTLNSNGQANYTVDPTNLPEDGTSQMVTIQANLPGQTTGVGAAGGDSVIIHQGDGTLTFGLGRQSIPTGDDLLARMYAKHLDNSPMANNTINYQLVDTASNTTLASGSATTDSSGYALIDIPYSKLKSDGESMKLNVSTKDSNDNTIDASDYYWVSDSEQFDTSGATLRDLDVSGSSGTVKVGDTVTLTINSPASIRAMVTMDRGRIYNPSMITLSKGNNSYSFTVTAAMAPSFTLTFNYFLNGMYHSEGAAFNVDESSQAVSINLTPASKTVIANQPTSIQVNTSDSNGNSLPTMMIAEVVSSNAYDLTSNTAPNMLETLFSPRPLMTNSASSLSPIGSGGGRCGGGGGSIPSFTNALSTTLYWDPRLGTDGNGNATITFSPPVGSWTVSVYAITDNTQVGYKSVTIKAQ